MEEKRIATETGVITEKIGPFQFAVKLASGAEVVCGLVRSYYGRMTYKEAERRVHRDGPHVGDTVMVRISNEHRREGTILRKDRL